MGVGSWGWLGVAERWRAVAMQQHLNRGEVAPGAELRDVDRQCLVEDGVDVQVVSPGHALRRGKPKLIHPNGE